MSAKLQPIFKPLVVLKKTDVMLPFVIVVEDISVLSLSNILDAVLVLDCFKWQF